MSQIISKALETGKDIAEAKEYVAEAEILHNKFQVELEKVAKKYGFGSTSKKSPKTQAKTKDADRGAKSEAIRDFLNGNENAKPKVVIEALSTAGLQVTPGLVSAIKQQLKKGGKKSPGRQHKNAGNSKAKAVAKKESVVVAKNDITLSALVMKILAYKKNKDGLKLADLVEEVVKAGHVTNSKKGNKGLSQMVYQECRKLRGGDAPILVKEVKRYKINPKKAA